MSEVQFHHDFLKVKPSLRDENIHQYLLHKKEEFKKKLTKNSRQRSSSAWFLVFVLGITLVGLGNFTLSEIQTNNQTIADLQKRTQVAGINEEQNLSYAPISGYGFTILPKEKAPEKFVLERKTVDSKIFPGRVAVVSSFVEEATREGKKLRSGIEVEVLEYDNRYNQKEFDSITQQALGANFEVVAENILIPRNFQISKIQDKSNRNTSYFTAVTTDNYYLIKIYEQTLDYPEFSESNKFTQGLLESLYLN